MPPLLPQLMWPSWEGQWSCQWCCPSVQFSCSVMSDSVWPLGSQHARPPCPPCPYQLPEFTQTHVHWVSDAIQPSHPLLSPSPAPNPSSGGQSTGVSAFSIIPSKEHPGLISFRMDWLDLPAVQGTHKSLLQHHSSKASKQMGPKTNLNKFKRMAITEYAILPHGIRLEIVTKTQNRKISTTGNHTSK